METTQPPPRPSAPCSVDTATRSEISALDDDDLLAFWLNAIREFNRLVWGTPENFRRIGDLVQHRVQWSQTEIEGRLRQLRATSTSSADS